MTSAANRQEGIMRVWAIMFKEFGSAEEIVVERHGEGFRHLMFADTTEGYNAALAAWRVVVNDRIPVGMATYEYGQFGTDARTEIIVRDSSQDHDDCCSGGYTGDTVALRPIEVIGG